MMMLIFAVLFVYIFGKMLKLAVKAAWGITKVLVNLVFLPIVLLALVFKGMVSLAIPVLAVVGIIGLLRGAEV